jgi:hypothetical protein
VRFDGDPLVQSYRVKIREFPDRGVKLKHPAISVLRAKRPSISSLTTGAFHLRDARANAAVQRPAAAFRSSRGHPEFYFDARRFLFAAHGE